MSLPGLRGARPRLRAAWGLLLAAVLPPAPAAGTGFPVRGVDRPRFVLDAVALPQGADSARVEITWEIPYQQLTFREEEGRYRALYDVTVVLAQGRNQVAGDVWEQRARARTFADTRGNGVAKGRRTLAVPTGKYHARVTVTDRIAHATSAAEADLDVALGPSRIGLSDLRFVRYTKEGPEANPGREIAAGDPGHYVRLTLHPQLAHGGTFRVRWKFLDAGGRGTISRDTTLVLASEPFPLEIPVPSDRLEVGVHDLEIRLEGAGGDTEESRHATFFVRLTARWFELHREEALEVLEILATSREIDELRDVSDAKWPARVRRFWKDRDPTPDTERNEYRDSIQERMETAAALFREPFRRPGWRTDRGRILIEFGRPDRRTVRSGSFDGPASELWEYESPRRIFFFVDERGSGEFWLRG
jgi:GWxTD domain-containing protein